MTIKLTNKETPTKKGRKFQRKIFDGTVTYWQNWDRILVRNKNGTIHWSKSMSDVRRFLNPAPPTEQEQFSLFK